MTDKLRDSSTVPLIVGLGWSLWDNLEVLEAYPIENSKTVAIESLDQAGGPTLRALMTVSKLGVKTAFVTAVGSDESGSRIISELESSGVDTTFVQTSSDSKTRKSQGWISQTKGSRTLVYSQDGPSVEFFSDEFRALIGRAAILLIDGREALVAVQASRAARDRKIPVIMDVGSPKEEFWILIESVTHLIIPRATLEIVTGQQIVTDAVKRVFDFAATSVIVVTDGLQGCTGFVRDEESFHVPVFPVDVVDSNGAGDVFAGGFTWALVAGNSISDAIEIASACAAVKCQSLGNGALPTILEMKEMRQSHG